jgi:hypothetical protein
MHRRGTGVVTAILAVAFAALTPAAPASAGRSTCPGWSPPPPQPVGTFSRLVDVAVLPGCRAVAVGSDEGTLIERWNGTAWRVQASVDPGDMENHLNAVVATSASNAWAVGYSVASHTGTTGDTLIEHWNGSTWTVQASPSPGTGYTILYDVAATSTTNAWAVGLRFDPPSDYRAIILHWDGHQWRIRQTLKSGLNSGFSAVAAASATDAWAVGSKSGHSLIEHWNGTAWRSVLAPNPAKFPTHLIAVTASSATNAWAVGFRVITPRRTLIEHWNGHLWTIVTSPNVGTEDNYLNAVVATSGSNAWAVGSRATASGYRNLVERWNGVAWKVQPSPNFGTSDNSLFGVDASSSTDAWAVGFYIPVVQGNPVPLALHCC